MPTIVVKTQPATYRIAGISYWIAGDRCRVAALTLFEQQQSNEFDLVLYHLQFQSLELFLKGFIWSCGGVSVDDLRHKYGHNVLKLWRQAKCLGIHKFATLTPNRDTTIQALGTYYKDRKFVYLDDIELIGTGFRKIRSVPQGPATLQKLINRLSETLKDPLFAAADPRT